MRGRTHSRLGVAALSAGLVACLAVAAPVASAKKKGGGSVNITKAVNLPIPDKGPGANGAEGVLTSTIDVGGRFKGKRVRDVNVTLQTLGTSGTTPADDLGARLVAPNGAHALLFSDLDGFGPTNLSIGPLTLDDEATLDLGQDGPDNATALYQPWSGTAAPLFPLFPLDNGPVRGTWRLDVFDQLNGGTSNLVQWRLNVVAGKPYRTR